MHLNAKWFYWLESWEWMEETGTKGWGGREEGADLPASRWWGYFTVWIRQMDRSACHLLFSPLQLLWLYLYVVAIYLSYGLYSHQSKSNAQIHSYCMGRKSREEVILEYWPPAYPLCLCMCALCECSWSTTEWSSASGGWPSSKPSSSRPRAPCLITTSTPRARSLNPGPRWYPSLRWTQTHHCRYNRLI